MYTPTYSHHYKYEHSIFSEIIDPIMGLGYSRRYAEDTIDWYMDNTGITEAILIVEIYDGDALPQLTDLIYTDLSRPSKEIKELVAALAGVKRWLELEEEYRTVKVYNRAGV